MILSNHRYPFGTKISRIQTPRFTCMVSTAKEGLLQRQSTMVSICSADGTIIYRRGVAKLIYASSLRSNDRLQFHDIVVASLDELGDKMYLSEAIDHVIQYFKERGVLNEGINIAWQEPQLPRHEPLSKSENAKIITDCPKCFQRLRIPSGRHLRVTCPKCAHVFEV